MLGLHRCGCLSVVVLVGAIYRWCSGFSMPWSVWFRAQALGRPGFGTCSSWAQELQLSGSSTGSIVVVHGLSCSVACGVFSDQGSNPCLLHWQVDSLPLDRQKSPILNSDESKVRSVLIKPTSLSQSS